MKKRLMAKQIPYGIYCDVGYDRDGNAVSCPWRHYNRQFKTVQCVYLHMLSDRYEDLLWDGCKECNVHLDDDERIVRKIERKQKKKP